jgi:hypothetical protein
MNQTLTDRSKLEMIARCTSKSASGAKSSGLPGVGSGRVGARRAPPAEASTGPFITPGGHSPTGTLGSWRTDLSLTGCWYFTAATPRSASDQAICSWARKARTYGTPSRRDDRAESALSTRGENSPRSRYERFALGLVLGTMPCGSVSSTVSRTAQSSTSGHGASGVTYQTEGIQCQAH